MEPTRRFHLLPAAGILLLTLLAYSNSLRGAFVYDDLAQIRDNQAIRDMGAFLGPAGYRSQPNRYVAYLTFALNYRLGKLDVAGYHAVNLAIHLANALLVYALVMLAFRAPRLAGSGLSRSTRAVAFAAAALFATHPIQTQAVSYLVQRITSLATLGYLASLVLYLAWRLGKEAGGATRRGAATYLAALLAALLATRTKEIAFTLPAAAALLEVGLFGRPARRRLLALLPFAAIALLIPATVLGLHRPAGEVLADVGTATRVQATGVGRADYLLTELLVVQAYLRLLLWPAGQNLDHDLPLQHSLSAPVAAALALHLGLLALAAWLWRRTAPGAARPLDPAARLVSLGLLFFFLALSVESSLIPIADVMYEHRVYLPSAGLFPAVAAGAGLLLLRAAPARWPRALAVGATALALTLAGATLWRNKVWRSDVALWTDAAAKSPGKSRAQLNLGTALLEAGRPGAALLPLQEAVRLDPASFWARAQLGAAWLTLGRLPEGEAELRQALRLRPADPESLFNLAALLHRTGRFEEARGLFARYLEVAPAAQAEARRFAAARLAEPPRPDRAR